MDITFNLLYVNIFLSNDLFLQISNKEKEVYENKKELIINLLDKRKKYQYRMFFSDNIDDKGLDKGLNIILIWIKGSINSIISNLSFYHLIEEKANHMVNDLANYFEKQNYKIISKYIDGITVTCDFEEVKTYTDAKSYISHIKEDFLDVKEAKLYISSKYGANFRIESFVSKAIWEY